MYVIDFKDALYFVVICVVVLEILGKMVYYRQQIAYTWVVLRLCIMPQLGLDVGGNFSIHIWAYSGDFIVRNRWTGNITVQ